ncbi:MAG: hypothetical protein GEV04_16080 [Actinophytocola sp.]|nr:hypothetical protein [Actinophytocola sp.]
MRVLAVIGSPKAGGRSTVATPAVLDGFFATQVLSPGLYLPDEAYVDGERLVEESAKLAAAHGAGLVDLAHAVRNSEALSGLRPLA